MKHPDLNLDEQRLLAGLARIEPIVQRAVAAAAAEKKPDALVPALVRAIGELVKEKELLKRQAARMAERFTSPMMAITPDGDMVRPDATAIERAGVEGRAVGMEAAATLISQGVAGLPAADKVRVTFESIAANLREGARMFLARNPAPPPAPITSLLKPLSPQAQERLKRSWLQFGRWPATAGPHDELEQVRFTPPGFPHEVEAEVQPVFSSGQLHQRQAEGSCPPDEEEEEEEEEEITCSGCGTSARWLPSAVARAGRLDCANCGRMLLVAQVVQVTCSAADAAEAEPPADIEREKP